MKEIRASFDRDSYLKDGFTITPGLFSAEELAPVISYLHAGHAQQKTFGIADQSGKKTELMVWTECGNDFIGILPRLRRMVDIATAATGSPVYHWHSKITLKQPGQQGSWDWHQDYGHWYDEGCLRPDMMSIGVALDPMHANNGPLKLLKGSHQLGRIDHVPLGAANGADPEYVERALEQLELVECHLAVGDAVVFHCNTLHASSANTSNEPRSFLLSSYNTTANVPWKPKVAGHACMELEVLDDEVLRKQQYQRIVQSSLTLQPEGMYGYDVLE